MGATHQQGAGIGHRRTAGFGHQAHIVAGAQRREEVFDVGDCGRRRQLLDRQFAQGHGMAGALQFGTRGLGIFSDKIGQPTRGFTGGRRQIVFPGRVAKGHRQQPERAGHGLS